MAHSNSIFTKGIFDGWRMPYALASIAFNGQESDTVNALLDTGASFTVVSMKSAKTMLGMSPEEIKASKTVEDFTPANAKKDDLRHKGYGWQVDLRVQGVSHKSKQITFSNIWIYVIESTHPCYPILIGQKGGFQDKILFHFNREKKPFWEIRMA